MKRNIWWYKGIMFGVWWAFFSWLPYFTGYWGRLHFLFSLPLMFGFAAAYLLPIEHFFLTREVVAFALSLPFGITLGYLLVLVVYKLHTLEMGGK